jgi:hypothetical protein
MRTNFRYHTGWLAVIAGALIVGTPAIFPHIIRAEVPGQAATVNADAAVISDFMKRVETYAALHHKVDSGLQEPPRDGRPETYIIHEQAFAKAIQQERPHAAPGDIFTKPMRNIVRRLLASVFRGPGGREIKKSILDEDTRHIPLQVNMQYPEGAPLSTMPLQIIQGLPKLPEGLEYRFIGDRLILLDAHARLIVDVVDRVFP